MDISPRMEQFIDGRKVEVGAQWNHPLSWPHLQVVTTCDSTSPVTYHAEVRMGGHVLVRTDPTDDITKAERTAEKSFSEKFAALFLV
jgi:hypothetical protein